MPKPFKPILVTGSHRSGSTWVGQILATAPHAAYIHEPFNIGIRISVGPSFAQYWFQHICPENSDRSMERAISQILHYDYPLRDNLVKLRNLRDGAKILRDQGRSWLNGIRNATPVVKDPIALFSAEYLAQRFDMNVLIMIRHPAAFCGSLKIKNWTFDFKHFLDQPLLMERHLQGFEDEIRDFAANERDVIEQGILLWNCLHHVISTYQQKHPEWLFVRHEDVSQNPCREFRKIFLELGLEFTQRVATSVLESSDSDRERGQRGEFKRDSGANILEWQNRLTEAEIDRIRAGTSNYSSRFYSDHEW